MTKQEWAEDQVQKLNAKMAEKGLPAMQGRGEVMEMASTEYFPLVALYRLDNHFRVAAAVGYVNRATRPQIDCFLKDFDGRNEAETLYLEILEAYGGYIFGDQFKLSVGSGLRFVKNHDYNTGKTIRIKVK